MNWHNNWAIVPVYIGQNRPLQQINAYRSIDVLPHIRTQIGNRSSGKKGFYHIPTQKT